MRTDAYKGEEGRENKEGGGGGGVRVEVKNRS